MYKKLTIVISSLWIFFNTANGQCPAIDLLISNSVCLGENLEISNVSIEGVTYEWDFCSKDMLATPDLSSVVTVSGGSTTTGITHILDDETWYGFVVSRENGKLFRLEYGHSLLNNPLMEEVGNETALTLGSEQIAIIKNEGNWYGVLVNWNNPKVLFANFGSSLENVPAISEIPMSVPINRPRGVKLIKDGHNFIALIGNTGASLTRLNFGNSMTNAPVADNIVVSGSSGLFGLSHI